jgi:hypothetical protein
LRVRLTSLQLSRRTGGLGSGTRCAPSCALRPPCRAPKSGADDPLQTNASLIWPAGGLAPAPPLRPAPRLSAAYADRRPRLGYETTAQNAARNERIQSRVTRRSKPSQRAPSGR